MPRVEVRKTIKAPRDFVFSQLADPNGLVKLIKTYTAINSVRKVGDVEVIEGKVEAMGRKGRATLRRKYFPPERIEEELDSPGMAEAKQTLTFSQTPEGTALVFVSDMTPKGTFAKLLGGLVAGRMKKIVNDNFEYAKKTLEAEKPK